MSKTRKTEEAKMGVVLETPEGNKVVVNTETDLCLYMAPHNPPFVFGNDYYAHKARSGNIYYYRHAWVRVQGEEDVFYLLDEETMRSILIDCASETGWARIIDSEFEAIEQCFPGIFEEDA